MTLKNLFFIFFLCFSWMCSAQNLSSVILDSLTKEPIPYVTVQLNKRGMITNEEGRFSFLLNDKIKETDSLKISCIGYESIGKPINEFTGSVIYLKSKAIELNPVIVTNKQYSPKEIIELVEENLTKNYHQGLSKKRLFLRQTFQNNIIKTNYTLKKSTIDAFNKAFLDSVLQTIPRSSNFYTEILGDLYGGSDAEAQKLDLIKASELYDKSKEIDYDNLEERFNEIVRKNVKTDSYYKIKSGLFGTKLDSLELKPSLRKSNGKRKEKQRRTQEILF